MDDFDFQLKKYIDSNRINQQFYTREYFENPQDAKLSSKNKLIESEIVELEALSLFRKVDLSSNGFITERDIIDTLAVVYPIVDIRAALRDINVETMRGRQLNKSEFIEFYAALKRYCYEWALFVERRLFFQTVDMVKELAWFGQLFEKQVPIILYNNNYLIDNLGCWRNKYQIRLYPLLRYQH